MAEAGAGKEAEEGNAQAGTEAKRMITAALAGIEIGENYEVRIPFRASAERFIRRQSRRPESKRRLSFPAFFGMI